MHGSRALIPLRDQILSRNDGGARVRHPQNPYLGAVFLFRISLSIYLPVHLSVSLLPRGGRLRPSACPFERVLRARASASLHTRAHLATLPSLPTPFFRPHRETTSGFRSRLINDLGDSARLGASSRSRRGDVRSVCSIGPGITERRPPTSSYLFLRLVTKSDARACALSRRSRGRKVRYGFAGQRRLLVLS